VTVESEKWVRIEWPSGFPRTLEEVAHDAGWQVRYQGETAFVRLEEHEDHREVRVFRAHRLGDVGSRYLDLERLASWTHPPHRVSISPTAIVSELERRQRGSFPVRLSGLRLGFSLAPAEKLPELVAGSLAKDLPELHGSVLYAVEVDHRLYHRQIAVARNLVRAVRDPTLLQRGQTDSTVLEGGIGLASSDLLGGAAMLLPALAATSPGQQGVLASRLAGSLVVLFPEVMLSPPDGDPASIADVLRPQFLSLPRTDLPQIPATASDSEAFLRWWIRRWNVVLGEMVDPATHRQRETFDPVVMLGRYHTLLRFLACVQQILVSTAQNEFMRMTLLFEAMDLAKGLGLGGDDRLAVPSRAQRDLVQLRSNLAGDPDVSQIVMPRCEGAVRALVDLRAGFVEHAGDADERVRSVIRALRNAKHGLGTGEGLADMLTLMEHRADFSPNLADLGWFWLIRMLTAHHWTTPASRPAEEGSE
jgi:hypothetical protein